eukprot:UC1_evm1s1443
MLPKAVLGFPYTAPAPENAQSAGGVLAAYLASNLPCGLNANSSSGSLSGVPGAAGEFSVSLQGRSDGGRLAVVNGAEFTLTVEECDDTLSCNGGSCVEDNSPYDGIFSCDCRGTGKEGK